VCQAPEDTVSARWLHPPLYPQGGGAPIVYEGPPRASPQRWIIVSIVAAILLGALPLRDAHAQTADTDSWRRIAPDLETTSASTGAFSADLILVRSRLERYRVGVVQATDHGVQRASVRRLVEATGAILGINANFFDEAGRPLGLVTSQGAVRQRLHGGGRTLTGVFAVDGRGPRIDSRISYSPVGVQEAIQAGPRLVTQGVPTAGLKSSGAAARRAGVCLDRENRLIFFAASSGFLGLTLEELQRILTRPEIDCRDALNLDGGGSAQLYVSPGVVAGGLRTAEIFIPGADEVPVMLGLFAR